MVRYESRWWEPDLSLGKQHRATRGALLGGLDQTAGLQLRMSMMSEDSRHTTKLL